MKSEAVLLLPSGCAQVGLGVAVEQCLALGQGAIWGRIQALAALLRAGLARVEGVRVQDVGATLCGIVSFTKVRERSEGGARVWCWLLAPGAACGDGASRVLKFREA